MGSSTVAALLLVIASCRSGKADGEGDGGGGGSGGGDGGGGGGGAGNPSIDITSPADGSTFEAGAPVQLLAEAKDAEGGALAVDSATWSAGDWTAGGNDLTVTDLPEGSLTLVVTAEAGGATLTDSVGITVTPVAVDDTGDPGDDTAEPPADVAYEGEIDAEVFYTGSYGEFSDPCPGWVAFTLSGDQTITGQGSCRAFSEDWDFEMEGAVSGSKVSGYLSMDFDKKVVPTPFAGTMDGKGHIDASFDAIHVPAEGEEIRVAGSFWGEPTAD